MQAIGRLTVEAVLEAGEVGETRTLALLLRTQQWRCASAHTPCTCARPSTTTKLQVGEVSANNFHLKGTVARYLVTRFAPCHMPVFTLPPLCILHPWDTAAAGTATAAAAVAVAGTYDGAAVCLTTTVSHQVFFHTGVFENADDEIIAGGWSTLGTERGWTQRYAR